MKSKKYIIPRPYAEVGEFLAEKRIAAGLTQKTISDKLGYSSAQFISNFERGIALPPLKKLKTIVTLCSIDPEEILNLVMKVEREILQNSMRGNKIKFGS